MKYAGVSNIFKKWENTWDTVRAFTHRGPDKYMTEKMRKYSATNILHRNLSEKKKWIQHHPWWSCLHPTSWVYPILHVKLREVPPPHGSVTCVQFQSERWPRETPHSTAWAKQLSRHMSDNKVLWALATWGIFCCFCSSWDVIWHLFCTSWLKKCTSFFHSVTLAFSLTALKTKTTVGEK